MAPLICRQCAIPLRPNGQIMRAGQGLTWTFRTLLPSLPTPAGISSLKWPKNRSTWAGISWTHQGLVRWRYFSRFFQSNLFVQRAEFGNERRRRSGLGQPVDILCIRKPDKDIMRIQSIWLSNLCLPTRTDPPAGSWRRGAAVQEAGFVHRSLVAWQTGPWGQISKSDDLRVAILTSVLEETNLRPFFQPKEWPLWNWPLSVGGTELRYLATILCSVIQLWTRTPLKSSNIHSHLKSGPGNMGRLGGLRSGKGILCVWKIHSQTVISLHEEHYSWALVELWKLCRYKWIMW